MHINEAYEHDPLLPCQGEEKPCPPSGCSKVGTQSVDVAAPLTLSPIAVVGSATVTCQGAPCVTCVTGDGGTSCTVTVTQRVSVAVPIRYSVAVEPDDPTIACADSRQGCCP